MLASQGTIHSRGITSSVITARGITSSLSDDAPTRLAAVMRGLSAVNNRYIRQFNSTTFGIGMHFGENKAVEYRMRQDADLILLLRGVYAGSDASIDSYFKPTLTGTFNTGTTNSYTTSIGASMSVTIKGTLIKFRHRKDTLGGLWSFTIDGGAPILVSVYNGSVLNGVETTLASGLSDIAHTVVGTFLGADPNNAPSGTARGWFVYDFATTGASANSTFRAEGGDYHLAGSDVLDVLSVASIPDFAISATRVGSGVAGDWVPEHAATGACRDITQALTVDGVVTSVNPADMASPIWFTESVVFTQTYTAYSTNDVAGNFPMWDGEIEHRFDDKGLTITHSLDFAYGDVSVGSGYLAMLPSETDKADVLLTGAGFKLKPLVPGDGSNIPFAALSGSAAWLNTTRKAGVAIDIDLTSALDINNAGGLQATPMFYQLRADTIAKVYWAMGQSRTVLSGTKMRCSNNIFATSGADFPAPWTS